MPQGPSSLLKEVPRSLVILRSRSPFLCLHPSYAFSIHRQNNRQDWIRTIFPFSCEPAQAYPPLSYYLPVAQTLQTEFIMHDCNPCIVSLSQDKRRGRVRASNARILVPVGMKRVCLRAVRDVRVLQFFPIDQIVARDTGIVVSTVSHAYPGIKDVRLASLLKVYFGVS